MWGYGVGVGLWFCGLLELGVCMCVFVCSGREGIGGNCE